MPVSKNTWNKGLNSDFSKLKSQQDSYLDAKNIRVMTDEGSSTFAIENIRGNEFSFNIPPVEATYTITKNPAIFNQPVYVNLTRGGVTTSLEITNVENKSYEDIADGLNNILQSSSFPGKEYIRFYYNSKGIVLYDFKPKSSTLQSLVLTTFDIDSILRTNKVDLHTILGWGYYNNTIVLITCESNNNDEDPQDREGFIWAATYDNATNTIQVTDLDGGYLNTDTTLRYAGKLELSRQYAIYKHLKCRYENNYTARVVWTDNYNNLRTCNILDPQIFASAPELFSYVPVHLPQKPIISIINGGFLPTGKYQYFYQLSSNQGAVSSFSPLSNLIFAYIGDSINFATAGSTQGTGSGKSMQMFIQNIDTNYDTIRVGYIVYQTAESPEAFFFDELNINASSMTFVHNGDENDIPVEPPATVTNLNKPPDIFKTIDVVRNRLFAANAKTRQFDLTDQFDARAYRFNASGIAKLYNTTDGYGNPSVLININNNTIAIEEDPAVSPIDYTLIPETFDCINPFNQEKDAYNPYSNNDWYNTAQYKYQNYPPTIIGGKGLNISYQFVTEEMEAKGTFFNTGTTYINPAANYAINYTYEFSDTYAYPGGRGLTMDCMKNPVLETLFTGYSRGEVYRFGIVFFDLYGYPSYPLWIGDIKFPFAYEEDDIQDSFGLTSLFNNGVIPPLNSPAQTTEKDGYNLPNTTGGQIDMLANITGGDYYIRLLSPGSTATVITYQELYSYNPTGSTTFNSLTADFNINSNQVTASNGQTAYVVMENNGSNVKFHMSTNDPIWLGYSVFVYRENSFTSETSVNFNMYGSAPGFNSGSGFPVIVKQLGITFSLDTSGAQFQAIKDKISGYSYVRLRRNESNSTRLGTGCLQPTFNMERDNKYMLTPFNYLNRSWGFTLGTDGGNGKNVRLGLQMYYAPNFLGQTLPSFAPEDYLRFIGRTNNFNVLLPYAAKIGVPDFGVYGAYYVASNDFTYTYSDPTNPLYQVGQSQPTNSYLATNNKFPIVTRVSVPYVTSAGELTIPAGPGNNGMVFRNMSNINVIAASNSEYLEWGVECVGITFNGTTANFPDTTVALSSTLILPFYLVSYERYLIEQYGGWARSDRYNNEYILTNHFQPIDGASNAFSDVYGGDTYVNYFDYQRTNINDAQGSGYEGGGLPGRGVAIFFPAEASFNADMNTVAQHASVRQNTDSIFASSYRFNAAYSQQNTTNIFVSKGYLQSNVIEEPHTIYPSQPKLDGETSDSWRTLLINDALAVNGNYGEINRIIQFKDKLFYYQNDGIGVAAVDERILVNEGDVTQTQLGTGTVLKRFDYISTETGCKHSFAVESTGSSIYHYDSFINKLFKYSVGKTKDDISGMNPLTDVKGLSGFFRTVFVGSNLKSEDKILKKDSRVGIVSAFNSEYNTIYFTFFDEPNQIKYTISYNELLDAFESFYDFYPSMYLNMRKRFISISTEDTFSEVYTHNVGIRNTFYDNYFQSSVTFRVNENSDFVKTFDNFQVNSEVILNNLQLAETVSYMSITNDYQNFPQDNANFVQKIRSWRLDIPRDETNPALIIKPRISDKYIDVKFVYNSLEKAPINTDKTFRLHDVITEYSMRSKIVPK
jgi:hypothetical protein